MDSTTSPCGLCYTGDMANKLTTRQKDKLIEAAQNAIEFTVEGKGEFPLDMLRYDRCWPATGSDANRIDTSLVPGVAPSRQVGLCGLIVPHIKRWQSFGWRVVESTAGVQ